jgi:uncharacterized protein (TIGR02145 family)
MIEDNCPKRWNIPTVIEWNRLINFLGSENATRKMKETGTLHWCAPYADSTKEID